MGLVPQQSTNLSERIGEYVLRETIFAMLRSEKVGQASQQLHIFGEVRGDVRFQDLEDSGLTLTSVGVAPCKAHDRADTRLGQYDWFDANRKALNPRPQFLLNDGADFPCVHVADSVLQLRESLPQGRTKIAVSRNHLA